MAQSFSFIENSEKQTLSNTVLPFKRPVEKGKSTISLLEFYSDLVPHYVINDCTSQLKHLGLHLGLELQQTTDMEYDLFRETVCNALNRNENTENPISEKTKNEIVEFYNRVHKMRKDRAAKAALEKIALDKAAERAAAKKAALEKIAIEEAGVRDAAEKAVAEKIAFEESRIRDAAEKVVADKIVLEEAGVRDAEKAVAEKIVLEEDGVRDAEKAVADKIVLEEAGVKDATEKAAADKMARSPNTVSSAQSGIEKANKEEKDLEKTVHSKTPGVEAEETKRSVQNSNQSKRDKGQSENSTAEKIRKKAAQKQAQPATTQKRKKDYIIKSEQSKPDFPRVKKPEVQTSKVQTHKVLIPEIQTPKVQTPKVQTPKVQTPEVQKPEDPKQETKEIRGIRRATP